MDEIELTEAEQDRAYDAAVQAFDVEHQRIRAERTLLEHIHRVPHAREPIDPDEDGKPTGWQDTMDRCPDCGRGLISAMVGELAARICSRLSPVAGALTTPRGFTEHDVIACGLSAAGVPLDG